MQGIRCALPGRDGRCAAGLDRDFHHRLFAGKAPPVEKARPFDVPPFARTFPSCTNSNTTPTSCLGKWWPRKRGPCCYVIPITDRGEIMLEQYEALLGPLNQAGHVGSRVEQPGHDACGGQGP